MYILLRYNIDYQEHPCGGVIETMPISIYYFIF